MHRLAAIPGAFEEDGALAYVEQPAAPVLLLSSADTDLVAIASLLEREPHLLGAALRALNLAALAHPAVIDHYLQHSVARAHLVVVRLLGGRGHWSYGLDRLGQWAAGAPGRHLLVLAGTPEEDRALAGLGTVSPPPGRRPGLMPTGRGSGQPAPAAGQPQQPAPGSGAGAAGAAHRPGSPPARLAQ
jgi:cobaltochelatase CobN